MMRYLVACCLLLLTAVTATDECRLYMAVSSESTAEEPKWGIYAGINFDENQEIGQPDSAVQLHNLMAHVMNEGDDEEDDFADKSLERKTVELLERYSWVADSSGAAWEINRPGKVTTVMPGTGLIAAYNAKLTNVAFNHSSAYFRPSLGESPGVAHPGRGASSHFYNVGLRTTTIIPSGGEIFLDYGENFAEEEEDVKLAVDDYNKVDQLVDSMIEFMAKYKDELNETSKLEIYNFLINDVMSAAAGSKKGKLVSNLLPDNPDELDQVKQAGGSLMFSSPQVKRNLEWLQKEGFCVDNLVVNASTIPNAGRGAFARRALEKAVTIAPVPLVHLPEKAMIVMHELDKDKTHRTSTEAVDQQLLLNYCLGHAESSMLFYPAGGVVPFINHGSGKQANAKLVWSKRSEHESHWFEKNPQDLAEEEYVYMGLLMELVATRNIKEGEEILIDYGKEWQAAWDAHVMEWDAKVASGEIKSEWPVRALDMNQEYRGTNKPYKTLAELEKDPYPENVTTYCFLNTALYENEDEDAPKPWMEPAKGTIFSTDYLYPCNMTDRTEMLKDGSYNYTVVTGKTINLKISDVPQKAVTFLDKPETSDQFFRGAFRHAIGIPDDIFPKGPWRNLAKK